MQQAHPFQPSSFNSLLRQQLPHIKPS
jgi:hypothetical protein